MKAYTIREPDENLALPVVVSIPHAGVNLVPGLRERLAGDHMRTLPMTDWHLPALFDFLPALGVTLIVAEMSRFVIDLNRSADGRALYPGRFETGLVPLTGFSAEPVFAVPPSAAELEQARREIYAPYHAALDALLERRRRGGRVAFFDLHSVTSEPTRISAALPAEVMLGDRDGRSCAPWFLEATAAAYREAGFSVVANDPYKGGWITERVGEQEETEALQVEMSWAAYLDPADLSAAPATPRFARARERLRVVWTRLLPDVCGRLRPA